MVWFGGLQLIDGKKKKPRAKNCEFNLGLRSLSTGLLIKLKSEH